MNFNPPTARAASPLPANRPRVHTPSWGRNNTHTRSQISESSRDHPLPSRFGQSLSINPPSLDVPIENSKFSPDLSPVHTRPTPHQRTQSSSSWKPNLHNGFYKPSPNTRDTRMTGTTAAGPASPKSTVRDRFTKMFFDLRTGGTPKEPDVMAIESRPPWSPLHVQNKPSTSKPGPQYTFPPPQQHSSHHLPLYNTRTTEKKKKPTWRAWALTALALLLLYLFASTIFLTARVAALTSRINSQTTVNNPSTPSTEGGPSDATSCIQQYTLNAPSAPTEFPCGTCLAPLQQLAASPEASNLSSVDGQALSNSVSFCGLKSVFDSADTEGQAALSNGGWLKDIRFCAWAGVSCDGSAKVSSLKLTTPAIPASLPLELGALSSLLTLQIIGDGDLPAGSPTIFQNLTSLQTLHLESTQLTQVPGSDLSTLTGLAPSLTTLTLVKNSQMGDAVLDAVMSLPLVNLIVNGQALALGVLGRLAASTALQGSLKILNLSNTSLTGAVPTGFTVSLRTLTELNLDANPGLTGTIPALPASP